MIEIDLTNIDWGRLPARTPADTTGRDPRQDPSLDLTPQQTSAGSLRGQAAFYIPTSRTERALRTLRALRCFALPARSPGQRANTGVNTAGPDGPPPACCAGCQRPSVNSAPRPAPPRTSARGCEQGREGSRATSPTFPIPRPAPIPLIALVFVKP